MNEVRGESRTRSKAATRQGHRFLLESRDRAQHRLRIPGATNLSSGDLVSKSHRQFFPCFETGQDDPMTIFEQRYAFIYMCDWPLKFDG
jgi:hypothetical protein